MTDEAMLAELLRSAITPVTAARPRGDLWPRVVEGGRRRRWSWFDIGLAAAAAGTLLFRPDLMVWLSYHL